MKPTIEDIARCLLRREGGAVELNMAELAQPGSILFRETHDGCHLELIELS